MGAVFACRRGSVGLCPEAVSKRLTRVHDRVHRAGGLRDTAAKCVLWASWRATYSGEWPDNGHFDVNWEGRNGAASAGPASGELLARVEAFPMGHALGGSVY